MIKTITIDNLDDHTSVTLQTQTINSEIQVDSKVLSSHADVFNYAPVTEISLDNSVQVVSGPKGDKGDTGTDSNHYTAQNKDSITIVKGSPVTQHNSGSGFERANGSIPSKFCVGILSADTANGFAGDIQTGGIITLSDWTAITGSVSLAAKAKYYLDTVAGKLSNVSPSGQGQISQLIGYAVDNQTLEIKIGYSTLL